MKYQKKSFWWGFSCGAASVYTYLFLITFLIATTQNSPLRNSSLFLMILSLLFALFVGLGFVREAQKRK